MAIESNQFGGDQSCSLLARRTTAGSGAPDLARFVIRFGIIEKIYLFGVVWEMWDNLLVRYGSGNFLWENVNNHQAGCSWTIMDILLFRCGSVYNLFLLITYLLLIPYYLFTKYSLHLLDLFTKYSFLSLLHWVNRVRSCPNYAILDKTLHFVHNLVATLMLVLTSLPLYWWWFVWPDGF